MKITFEGQENLTPFRYITGNQQTGKQAAEEASFNAGDALTLVDIGTNIQGASDVCVRIEMDGFESLNVAVAGGILMYRFRG